MTEPQHARHSLMTWSTETPAREHVIAALGVVIGSLSTILLLVAVAVIR